MKNHLIRDRIGITWMLMNCTLPGVPSGVVLWLSELYTKNELSDFLAIETTYGLIDITQFWVTTVLVNVPQANVNFSKLQKKKD